MKPAKVMALILGLLFGLLPTILFAQSAPSVSESKVAEQGQFPWSAYVVREDGSSFSATLIDKQWLVTCRHCVKNVVGSMTVYLGGVDKTVVELGEIQVQSTLVITMPGYDPKTGENDFALIRIPPIRETALIKPISLYTETFKVMSEPTIITGTLIGWGRDENRENDQLRYAEVTFICRNIGLGGIKCQSPYDPGIGACAGDSGTGFQNQEKQLRAVAWGGDSCDSERRFTSLNEIAPNAEWIENTIEKYSLEFTYMPFAGGFP